MSIQVTEEFDLAKLSNNNQFDYGLLNTEARIVAKQRASEIKSLMHQGTQNIIEIGQKLIEVKEKLEHGQFENWVKVEFDWSLRSARNFMLVAHQFKSANFADLNIDPSALYELAAPSVPEIVRQEILERAGQGEKIIYTKAKSVLAHHKPSKPKEAKRVTVDTPSQTVGRESFAESLTVKPALIEEADVDPTRYATPQRNLVTVGDVPEVEVDQDEQDLAEDQEELGQPIKGEQASMHVASFTLLHQSTQIEESQLGKDAKEQNFEVIVQPAETVEVPVVEVAEEVDPEIAGESVQETVTNEYQPEDTQAHDVHLRAQYSSVREHLTFAKISGSKLTIEISRSKL